MIISTENAHAFFCPLKTHFRTARDADYLLISEDIDTYGCGCCSIGVGKAEPFKEVTFCVQVLLCNKDLKQQHPVS